MDFYLCEVQLDEHILRLLTEHDCVIVPELGGFVANYDPAQFNGHHLLSAPSKRITFNQRLTSNDGLLINAVQRWHEVDYETSVSKVRDQVLVWKQHLKDNRRLVIKGLGHLYEDNLQNIRFTPELNGNLLMDAFGLPAIQLEPIAVEETPALVEEQSAKIIPIESGANWASKEKNSRQGRKRLGWAIAAACLIPLTFYSVWIPSKTDALDRGYLRGSDFNPFTSSTPNSQYRPGKHSSFALPEEAPQFEDRLVLELENGVKKIYQVAIDATEVVHAAENDRPPGLRYHVISGCFGSMDNALNKVADLQTMGYDSYILDLNGGLNRVCAASFATKKEAAKALRELKNLGRTGWVLRK